MEKPKISVLFVCMGNICRSPTGEGVFQHYVEHNGNADQFQIWTRQGPLPITQVNLLMLACVRQLKNEATTLNLLHAK